ncbi:OLC1v1000800C1 [Oldenlandia corymbosa var. corymbosa]|uniref:OLC1v1000800C1 n=1 Tax=Oldenlandia corymbosa var. corymbosa TaxID=529605 RepID=A0AAV1D4J8_OLDCO|nr:OLC1v1000800C1 [Oldenlandia corymbosa var. corymbosa]
MEYFEQEARQMMAGIVGGVEEEEVGGFWDCRSLCARVWVGVDDPLVPEALGLRINEDDSFRLYTAAIWAHRHMSEVRFTWIPESYVQEFQCRFTENWVGLIANGFRYQLLEGRDLPWQIDNTWGRSDGDRGGGRCGGMRTRELTTEDPPVNLPSPSNFPVDLDRVEEIPWETRPRIYEEDGEVKEEELINVNGQTQALRPGPPSWDGFFTTDNQKELPEWWEPDFFILAKRWVLDNGGEENGELNAGCQEIIDGGKKVQILGEVFKCGLDMNDPMKNCGLRGFDLMEPFTEEAKEEEVMGQNDDNSMEDNDEDEDMEDLLGLAYRVWNDGQAGNRGGEN